MTGFVTVARIEDLPPGTVKTFYVENEHIALANVNGEVYALEDVCTHDGGPLGEGVVEGHEVECPRHGARFDVRTGAATGFPAVVGVKGHRVQVDGSEIRVELE